MMIVCLFVISGLIVALGQSAWIGSIGPLAASLGFALHLRGLDKVSSTLASKMAFVWFFLVELVQFSWLTDLTYQGCYIFLAYIGFCSLFAGQFAYFVTIFRRSSILKGKTIIGLAGLWVLCEWSRFYIFCGIPFNFVGLSLACDLWSLQMASLAGVLGLSFWVIYTNLFCVRFLRKMDSFPYFLQWIVVACFPYIWGGISLMYQGEASYSVDGYQALLIQTGLLPSQKYQVPGKEADYIFPIKQWESILEEISLYKQSKVDMLLLPEAALPMGTDRCVYEKTIVDDLLWRALGENISESLPQCHHTKVSNSYIAQTLANFFDAQVIIGLDREEGVDFYNSMASFEKDKNPGFYDKQILIPFGEYIPFSFLAKLAQIYGVEGSFSFGREDKVLGKYRIFPSICYENLFPEYMRKSRKLEAHALVNITNDGWFPVSKLSKQHFFHARVRAVENRMPLLQCSAMGETAVIDAAGNIVDRLVSSDRGSLYVTVPNLKSPSLFAYMGSTPFVIVCAFFAFLLQNVFQLRKPIIAYP